MGQIAQDAWIRGVGVVGGQPNLGNACILEVSVPYTPPLYNSLLIHNIFWSRKPGQRINTPLLLHVFVHSSEETQLMLFAPKVTIDELVFLELLPNPTGRRRFSL